MKKNNLALITGISLLLMTVVAGYAFGFALNEFYTQDNLNILKDNILNNIDLYNNMIFSIILILILDLIVSITIYFYFKNTNKIISLSSGLLRIIYTLIFGYATYFLVENLNSDLLTNEIAKSNFESFNSIWFFGLVIFGLHIVLMGMLMKMESSIPKLLSYLAILAGLSYVIVHILLLLSPDSDFVSILQMILGAPMALGEIAFAIWLVIKGRKVS